MSAPKIEYNIAIEAGDEQVLVQWGQHPHWQREYAGLLENAQKISFIPKEKDSGYPIVTVAMDEEKRWIIFSRVYGQVTSGKQIRLYAIGWQSTIKGVNVKSIQWVYPRGTVECAETPTMVNEFLK